MPSAPNEPRIPAARIPAAALDAFLDGVLAELGDPVDKAALDEVRAAFRRRVPFNLRSYAAAALILRAAGLSRSPSRPVVPLRENQPAETFPPPRTKGPKKDQNPNLARRAEPGKAKSTDKPLAAENEKSRSDVEPRPRFIGEGATIFFSMGKRQRLYPRALIDIIVGAGFRLEDIGEVRPFDNYSFVDIAPARANALVAALDGTEIKGRRISVSFAKKKDET